MRVLFSLLQPEYNDAPPSRETALANLLSTM